MNSSGPVGRLPGPVGLVRDNLPVRVKRSSCHDRQCYGRLNSSLPTHRRTLAGTDHECGLDLCRIRGQLGGRSVQDQGAVKGQICAGSGGSLGSDLCRICIFFKVSCCLDEHRSHSQLTLPLPLPHSNATHTQSSHSDSHISVQTDYVLWVIPRQT